MPIPPYGEKIVNRIIPDDALREHLKNAKETITLSQGDFINLHNLAVGCYSPLTGFMTEVECESVMQSNKLPVGLNWTVPILLRVESRPQKGEVALCNRQGTPVGVLEIESIFEIGKEKFCRKVFGTADKGHPGVRETMRKGAICVGGKIAMGKSKTENLRYLRTPKETRDWLRGTKKKTFTAFSTRNICHIGHEYLHGIALEITDMLGINVITGAETEGCFLPDVVFDTYEHLLSRLYLRGQVFLNNLRLPPIYAGPKETFLQAIVLQNYGFTHFIVGRDHAGINNYYPKYGSQRIFEELNNLDIHILPFPEPRFCRTCGEVTTELSCRHGDDNIRYLNGRDIRRSLLEKKYDEVETIINKDLQEVLREILERGTEIIFKR